MKVKPGDLGQTALWQASSPCGGLSFLGRPDAFDATIAGFVASDVNDLLATTATGASVNVSDQLVVVDGATPVAPLQLSGNCKGATFTTTSDGAGGTDIGLVSPPTRPFPPSRAWSRRWR